ncbi:MAG: hypothetical protein CSB34_04830 [Desulfobulbus propionicus]|nr:MAG: hypothetical protein CSB34_04830 [Desulfobulbus propionicus]
MIVFDLQCSCGYLFEGWFENREDFDRQSSEGLVRCPACSGDEITKILSPVSSLSLPGRQRGQQPSQNLIAEQVNTAMVELLHSVQHFVQEHFENVGADFTKESLKMHYGVEEQRNIYGVTTPEQDKILKEEGIEVLKIPYIDEGNDSDCN